MARRLVVWLFSVFVVFVPTRALAQVPLSQLLVNLIQADVHLAPPPPGNVSHEAHFLPGVDQTLAPYLFNQNLIAQLASFPIGTPSGGFAFTFDPTLGTFQRATDSFGPTFADRALTNGRKKLTIGANFQYSKYTSFQDRNLDSGDIKFYLTHQDLPGDLFFEGDLVETALQLDLSSSTTTVYANYGVADALDLAVAVPIVHVSMDATNNATVLRLATAGSDIHSFPGGGLTSSFHDSGEATGIGDILLRAKYRFVARPGGGLAAVGELRLPTGDVDNLLGQGAAGFGITFIGSSVSGRFGPHFNVGFTGAGESDVADISNEFNYKFGTEFVATPTVTLLADFLGRRLLDTGGLELVDKVHTWTTAAGVHGSTTFQEYVAREGGLNLLNLSFGGKFNIGGNFLLNANVLFAVNNAGVTARVTPVIGFDYSF